MILLQRQNIVQYAHCPDDGGNAIMKTWAGNGMTIFRILDALNDTRNIVRDRCCEN
ncbi:MAG: hypothetical protein HRT56_06500 [Coraliomargarita sp.]|nr:hypothetical protein [Coraliomargarita sp.]